MVRTLRCGRNNPGSNPGTVRAEWNIWARNWLQHFWPFPHWPFVREFASFFFFTVLHIILETFNGQAPIGQFITDVFFKVNYQTKHSANGQRHWDLRQISLENNNINNYATTFFSFRLKILLYWALVVYCLLHEQVSNYFKLSRSVPWSSNG